MTTETQDQAPQPPTSPPTTADPPHLDSVADVLQEIGGQLSKQSHGGQLAIVAICVIINELGEGQIVATPTTASANPHIVQAAQNLANVIAICRPKRKPQPMLEEAPPVDPPETAPPAQPER